MLAPNPSPVDRLQRSHRAHFVEDLDAPGVNRQAAEILGLFEGRLLPRGLQP